jgi:hypothetical protein
LYEQTDRLVQAMSVFNPGKGGQESGAARTAPRLLREQAKPEVAGRLGKFAAAGG